MNLKNLYNQAMFEVTGSEIWLKMEKRRITRESLNYGKPPQYNPVTMKKTLVSVCVLICVCSVMAFSSMRPLYDYEQIMFEDIQIEDIVEVIEPVVYTDPVNIYRKDIPEEWIHIFIEIESEWNPLAYNRSSEATGLCQITPIALQDFNDWNTENKTYTMYDMWDVSKNIEVGCWLLNRYKDLMTARGNWTSDDDENQFRLYIAFWSGIGNFFNHYWKYYKHGASPYGGNQAAQTVARYNAKKAAYQENPIQITWVLD
jgi:hypothetical protein